MLSMATTSEGGEKVILSTFDTRILLALLIGSMTGYEIARQCELDIKEQQKASNGTIYPALKSLEQCSFVEIIDTPNRPGKKPKVYKITSIGKLVLSWKIDNLKEIIRLYKARV
jgi:PadR family transcriptional regulator, regulatory protein PadR